MSADDMEDTLTGLLEATPGVEYELATLPSLTEAGKVELVVEATYPDGMQRTFRAPSVLWAVDMAGTYVDWWIDGRLGWLS